MRNFIFGKYIKEIREKKGISQAEVARRPGHASNSYVRDIFALVGMDQLFEIYATVEEALESCSEEWSDSDGVMQ